MNAKVVLKCVTTMPGVLFVMMALGHRKLVWLAFNSDFPEMVSNSTNQTFILLGFSPSPLMCGMYLYIYRDKLVLCLIMVILRMSINPSHRTGRIIITRSAI